MSERAFDKLRLIDCLFSEFSAACDLAEVVEETVVSEGLKELVLLGDWVRPLHVVVIVDLVHQEDRSCDRVRARPDALVRGPSYPSIDALRPM